MSFSVRFWLWMWVTYLDSGRLAQYVAPTYTPSSMMNWNWCLPPFALDNSKICKYTISCFWGMIKYVPPPSLHSSRPTPPQSLVSTVCRRKAPVFKWDGVCVCVCMGSSSERTTDNWVLLVFGVGTVTFSSRSVFFVQSLFGEKNLVCRGWGRKLLCYPPFLLHTWRLNSVWGFLNKKREIRYYSEAYLTQESKPSKEIKPTTLPLSDSLRHIVRNRFIFSLCLFSEVQILNLW